MSKPQPPAPSPHPTTSDTPWREEFGPAQISGFFHSADEYTKAWLCDRAKQILEDKTPL